MQRLELVKEIVQKTGSEKHSVETILKTFMTSVEEHLTKGGHISLSGFGRFGVKKRAAKMGRNISKNMPLKIPAYFSPVFKPSKVFIRKVKKHTNIIIYSNMNINKFRLIKVSEETPTSLLFFKVIDGVDVYQSGINTTIYILHDPTIGIYYSLQYLKQTFETLDLDLHKNIERYVRGLNSFISSN
jgi:DNA-binding protein HU-beta